MSCSQLFIGRVAHRRSAPVHAFRYPVLFASVDLEELENGSLAIGHNRFGLMSIHNRDYLQPGQGSLRQKLESLLQEHGTELPSGPVSLITVPRLLGYVFNPVSFFLCHDAQGVIQVVVAEVNNTFHERHWYILKDPVRSQSGQQLRFRSAKVFHVSPFFDRSGHYEFSFSVSPGKFAARIGLVQDGILALFASLSGSGIELTKPLVRRAILRYPMTIAATTPRILWQAAKLHFLRGLPVYSKPLPASPLTITTRKPTLRESACRSIALRFLVRMKRGYAVLRLPDGTVHELGEHASKPGVSITIRDWSFFTKVVTQGDVGFGESYTAGDWECSDLTALLRLMIENQDVLDDRNITVTWLGRLMNRLIHVRRRNTESGSRENIPAHYDLSNELFAAFLDTEMMYSCAMFAHEGQSLEEAQRNKIRSMIAKAKISADDHVLEIGCGWGGFAVEAVRQTGCRVTGVTLSECQLQMARQRSLDAGLSDRIDFQLCDYRHIEGQFDKIVSIEMLEAVGHEHFGVFFDVCDRLLKPNGIVAVQFISIPDQRYDAYRNGCDWIQKHIFPGGHLPSLAVVTNAAAQQSRFIIDHLENIGLDYARTLREWRTRFQSKWESLESQGFNEAFRRTWEYYFCYCEAAFASNYLGTLQVVMTRSGERGLPWIAGGAK